MKKDKNNVKGRGSIAFVKEKMCSKSVLWVGVAERGEGSKVCLSFFPIGNHAMWVA